MRFHLPGGTSLLMREQVPPAPPLPDTAGAAPDWEPDNLLTNDRWLATFEPFEINWELIWVM